MKLDVILEELKEYGVEVSDVSIIIEPEHSQEMLLGFEKTNSINTSEVILGKTLLLDKPELLLEWKYWYARFLDFGGLETEINSIKK